MHVPSDHCQLQFHINARPPLLKLYTYWWWCWLSIPYKESTQEFDHFTCNAYTFSDVKETWMHLPGLVMAVSTVTLEISCRVFPFSICNNLHTAWLVLAQSEKHSTTPVVSASKKAEVKKLAPSLTRLELTRSRELVLDTESKWQVVARYWSESAAQTTTCESVGLVTARPERVPVTENSVPKEMELPAISTRQIHVLRPRWKHSTLVMRQNEGTSLPTNAKWCKYMVSEIKSHPKHPKTIISS